MNRVLLEKAAAAARRVGRVFLTVAAPGGAPFIAPVRFGEIDAASRVVVEEWICPAALEDLERHRRTVLLVYDPAVDEGFQIIGGLEAVSDTQMLDGYAAGAPGGVPQVRRRLVIRPTQVLALKTCDAIRGAFDPGEPMGAGDECTCCGVEREAACPEPGSPPGA